MKKQPAPEPKKKLVGAALAASLAKARRLEEAKAEKAEKKPASLKPSAVAAITAVRKAAEAKQSKAHTGSKSPAASKAGAKGKAASKPAPKPKPTRAEILERILAMRASDTRKDAERAAQHARQVPNDPSRVPTSVAKARELADARKSPPANNAGPRNGNGAEGGTRPKSRKRRRAPYTRTELKELNDILTRERDRLVRDLAMINDLATSAEESMSRSFSNHQADAATDSSALETTFMTRRFEEERLSQVIDALRRLSEGVYGLCEMCADEPLKECESCPFIPIGRLRAKPFARLCLVCREKLEKGKAA